MIIKFLLLFEIITMIISIGLSIFLGDRFFYQRKNVDVTLGKVISFKEEYSSSSSGADSFDTSVIMYTPIFQYEYKGKNYINNQFKESSHPAAYEMGEKVLLMVKKDNPLEIYDKNSYFLLYFSIGLIIYSIINLIITIILIKQIKKNKNKENLSYQ